MRSMMTWRTAGGPVVAVALRLSFSAPSERPCRLQKGTGNCHECVWIVRSKSALELSINAIATALRNSG